MTGLTFPEALERLKKGAPIRRENWGIWWICPWIKKGPLMAYSRECAPPEERPAILTFEDLFATDWESDA